MHRHIQAVSIFPRELHYNIHNQPMVAMYPMKRRDSGSWNLAYKPHPGGFLGTQTYRSKKETHFYLIKKTPSAGHNRVTPPPRTVGPFGLCPLPGGGEGGGGSRGRVPGRVPGDSTSPPPPGGLHALEKNNWREHV